MSDIITTIIYTRETAAILSILSGKTKPDTYKPDNEQRFRQTHCTVGKTTLSNNPRTENCKNRDWRQHEVHETQYEYPEGQVNSCMFHYN